jgi:D-alanine-D-alanine ligase
VSRTTRIALVFGGVSAEHEISCVTAGGIFRAIDRSKFTPVGVGITKSGRWVRVSDAELASFELSSGQLPYVGENHPDAMLLRTAAGVELVTREGDGLSEVLDIDAAFPVLHGPFGEDGTIQGLFEMLDLPYVGAGVASSAMSMDKDITKKLLSEAGFEVAKWVLVTRRRWEFEREKVTGEVSALGLPVFVKPARSGSSVGVSRVTDLAELPAAIAKAQAQDPKVIVEEGILGAREVEIGVIGGRGLNPPRASCPGEIVVAGNEGFYDYDAKYRGVDFVSLKAPAEVSQELAKRLRQVAVGVFETMLVEGLARVDTFVVGERIVVNELNTMPGFTSGSLFPVVWGVSGLPYTELITELVTLALGRPLRLR